MKRFINNVLILSFSLTAFIVAASWFVFEYKKDWIKQELLSSINEKFEGRIFIEELSYDPIFSFPKIALSLNDVVFFENKTGDLELEIFSIDVVNLDFNLKDLISNSKIKIEEIVIENASLKLVEYAEDWNISKSFSLNEEVFQKTNSSSEESLFELAIEELIVKKFNLTILLEGNQNPEEIKFRNIEAKLAYEHGVLDVKLKSDQYIQLSILESKSIKDLGVSTLKSDFYVDLNKEEIHVRTGELGFEFDSYDFSGFYDFRKEHKIQLKFIGVTKLQKDAKPFTEGTFVTSFGINEKSLNLKMACFGINISNALNEYDADQFANGVVDLNLDFKFRGKDFTSFLHDSKASVSISGKNIMLYGVDLDNLLKNYQKSQNFSLVDVGAYAFAGPFGAVVVKGSDFTRLLTTKFTELDSSRIQEIILDVELSKGIMTTKDVAFSTDNNRLAMFGELDLVNDSIPNCKIVVLTDRACEVLSQKFYGKLDDIQLEEVKVVKTLMGSVVNLFHKIILKKCDPVYFGTIEHPQHVELNESLINGKKKTIFE